MLADSMDRHGSLQTASDKSPAHGRDLANVYAAGQNYGDEGPHQGLDVVHYINIILRHWLVISAVVLIALGIGLASLLLRQPVYTATVTMQIDREPSNQLVKLPGGQSVPEAVSSEEFFQTQYGLLRSRTLALRTIEKLGLIQDPAGRKALKLDRGASGRTPSAKVEKAALRQFQKNLAVLPVRGSRLVNISFDSTDPALSARVANSLAENFISSNVERRYEASSYNRNFLADQLQKEKVKLEEAERQLASYAKAQQLINIPTANEKSGSSSANQSLTASSLVTLNEALAGAHGDRIKAEARWRQAAGSSDAALVEVLNNPTIQELKQVQAKLQADYEEKARVQRPSMPEMQQLQARIAENDRRLQAEVANVKNSLRVQFEVARDQERQFENQVAQLKGSVLELRDRSINYDILQREVDTSRQLYEGLLQTYREIGVAGDLRANNFFIIDQAEVPTSPSKPQPLMTMLVALGAGLLCGILAAISMEFMDESIRSPEDVERKLGVTLLGTIPKLPKGQTPYDALADIRSAFSEAYYSVRTALQFSTNEGVPSSLLVTSSRPAEGKSTSARAIAINFARLGHRVLLVDCDLRNPSLHRIFGEDNAAGLSNFLTGGASLVELARPTEISNLSFIPSGPLPPSPAELLASNRAQEMLAEAKANFDTLVIDGPPVMGLADAPLIASLVAGTLVVIESGGTGRKLAKSTIRRLAVGRARLLGVLLTKFEASKTSYGYGSGYSYAYDYNYGDRPALKG